MFRSPSMGRMRQRDRPRAPRPLCDCFGVSVCCAIQFSHRKVWTVTDAALVDFPTPKINQICTKSDRFGSDFDSKSNPNLREIM